MKRLFIVTLAVVIGFLTGIVSTASADSIQGKSAVGVNLMYVMPSGGASVGDIDLSADLDSAIGFGATYTYGLAQTWALEVSLDRSSNDVKDSGINFATSDITTLAFTGQYRPEISSMTLSPYVGIGMGYSYVSHSLSSEAKDTLCYDSSPCRIYGGNNAIAVLLNAGVDYFINDNWAIVAEGRYTISSVEPQLQFNDAIYDYNLDFELNLDRIDLRTGVKYYF